jgi:hypothetical protein
MLNKMFDLFKFQSVSYFYIPNKVNSYGARIGTSGLRHLTYQPDTDISTLTQITTGLCGHTVTDIFISHFIGKGCQ